MKIGLRIVVIACLSVLAPGLLCSYEPVVVLVGAAGATSGSNSPVPVVPTLSAGVELDWRFPAGRTGYAALWGTASVESQLLNGFPLDDREAFGVELGGFPGGVDLTGSASVATTSGLLDSSARVEPGWNLTGLVPLGQRPMSLGAAYSGSLRWSESDAVERVENRLSLRAVSEPSFTALYRYDLTTGVDFFPETYLSDQNGDATTEKRRDIVALANVNLDVLSDYFTRWNGEVAAGARFSNATRYLAATGTLEDSSEDRVFGSFALGLALSPASSLSVNFAFSSDAAAYLGHAALDDGGTPLSANLAYLRSTAGVTATWSPFGHFFVVGNLSAAGALSNDPLYGGWSSTANVSAQWRL